VPRTTTKPKKKTKAGAKPLNGQAPEAPAGDVLTLKEAAAYLRLAESEVKSLVNSQGLPGRAVGDEWRFLKSALQDWLRTPAAQGSKEAVPSVIGSCWDDPMEIEYRKELSRIRGRDLFEGL
jgi:excisionase family DNA binding protein